MACTGDALTMFRSGELIAQLQQCPPEFDVQVLEPRNEKDADGMFSVAIVVPADKTPTIYLTA
jgi:hypothetical protein